MSPMHRVLFVLCAAAILLLLFGIPLFFVLRVMAREMRKDARLGLNAATYDRYWRAYAFFGLAVLVWGLWYRQWMLIVGFGGFAAIMVALVKLSQRPAE